MTLPPTKLNLGYGWFSKLRGVQGFKNNLVSVFVDEGITPENSDKYRNLFSLKKPLTISAVSREKLRLFVELHNEDVAAENLLTDNERDRYAAFRYTKRKEEWLGGRIAAKQAAAKYIDHAIPISETKWREWQVIADDQGKPYIMYLGGVEKQNAPHISISHSKDLAVAMAAANICGIDIQKQTATVVRVRDRFATPAEIRLLKNSKNLAGKEKALTLLWAAKEAVRKTFSPIALLGFKEMVLENIETNQDHETYFDFSLPPSESSEWDELGGNGKIRLQIPVRQRVITFFYNDYAVAFTVAH